MKKIVFSIAYVTLSLMAFSVHAGNGSPIYSEEPKPVDPGNAGAPNLGGGGLVVVPPVVMPEPTGPKNPPPSVSRPQPTPQPTPYPTRGQ